MTRLLTPSGNKAKDQHVYARYGGYVFVSYLTDIAMIRDGKLYLTSYWDYSMTTLKYLKVFMLNRGLSPCNKAEIIRKIESGDFILVEDLCSI